MKIELGRVRFYGVVSSGKCKTSFILEGEDASPTEDFDIILMVHVQSTFGLPRSNLSSVLAGSASQLTLLGQGLNQGCQMLQNGTAVTTGVCLPHQLIGQALNEFGGIVCSSLEAMKLQCPTLQDAPFLEQIRAGIFRVKVCAVWVLEKLGSENPLHELRRFDYKYMEVFSVDWHVRQRQRERNALAHLERLLDAVAHGVRNFLWWLKDKLINLEKGFVVDEMRPVELSDYARGFVIACDRRRGVIVLEDAALNLLTFRISPQATKAWRILRLLLGARVDGVELEKTYASHFRNTDRQNNRVENDLSRLLRYIHSLGNGRYRLEPREREG